MPRDVGGAPRSREADRIDLLALILVSIWALGGSLILLLDRSGALSFFDLPLGLYVFAQAALLAAMAAALRLRA